MHDHGKKLWRVSETSGGQLADLSPAGRPHFLRLRTSLRPHFLVTYTDLQIRAFYQVKETAMPNNNVIDITERLAKKKSRIPISPQEEGAFVANEVLHAILDRTDQSDLAEAAANAAEFFLHWMAGMPSPDQHAFLSTALAALFNEAVWPVNASVSNDPK